MSLSKYRSARSPEMAELYRARSQMLREEYQGVVPCQLCNNVNNKIVFETATVEVVENLYPYEFFDGRLVAEHLMIIPKRHINHMSDFTTAEQSDYWQTLVHYYESGYTTVTRTAADSNRTVADHLHTHLFSYKQPDAS